MPSDVRTQADIDGCIAGNQAAVIHFWASWSEPCKHMGTVLDALSKEHSSLVFLRVEAEEADDLTMKYEITMVPSFVMIKAGQVIDRLEGADPPALADKVARLARGTAPSAAVATPAVSAAVSGTPEADVTGRIKFLLSSHPVVLFMKGNAETPRCGFSRKVVDALQKDKAPLHTVDILQDEALRQGLKKYSDWPTYPQLYIKSELVGGCDIILEMAATGELAKTLEDKLGPNYQQLAGTTSNEVSPAPASAPVAASTVAPAAAAAPKSISSASKSDALTERIKLLLASKPVMLFMKGDREEPRCGFSSKVVAALQSLDIEFGTFDILSDEAIRQGVKEYSKWPTYPQLYVAGELLGGCDIVLEMEGSGDLKSTVVEMLGKLGGSS